MAQGDNKRTYVITDASVKIVDALEENTRLDKSDVVDRAIKEFYKNAKDGKIDSALVGDDVEEAAKQAKKEEDDSSGGILERLRNKK